MARVSRAVNYSINEKAQVKYSVGLYHRLSNEDERDNEDNSIGNQHKICMEYLEQMENAKLVETYIDNGATGTNFVREGFVRMMGDIRTKRVNCIIVKDLSRFGRNFLESSEYLEKIFPAVGVRFIAVNNGYDSEMGTDGKLGIVVPFSNMVNEMYARDTSRKIRSSIDTLMKKGEFLPAAGSIPYGYLRDKEHNTYQTDLETAGVVKSIFEMKLEGMSNCGIAKCLNQENIPSPGRIRYLRGMSRDQRNETALWTHKAVKEILKNEAYVGHRIHGKVKRDHIGETKERKATDTWQYVYHAHPAIITEEDFFKVQAILGESENRRDSFKKRASVDSKKQELLQGKVFCGDCGSLMSVMKRNQRITSDRNPELFYQCNGYQYSGRLVCSNHYLSQKALLEKIQNAIDLQVSLVVDVKKLLEDTSLIRYENTWDGKAAVQIREMEAEIRKNQIKAERLLADYNDGVLGKQEYLYIKERYDSKALELEYQLSLAREEKARADRRTQRISDWMQALMDYRQSKKMDRLLVEKLIDKIYIFSDKSVEIQFHFKDEFKEMTEWIRQGKEAMADGEFAV